MPCQAKTYQLDLFCKPHAVETAQTPPWRALPEETQRTLMDLMVRLILDHVTGEPAVRREEARDDA